MKKLIISLLFAIATTVLLFAAVGYTTIHPESVKYFGSAVFGLGIFGSIWWFFWIVFDTGESDHGKY